jgi:hypothetical protein
MRRMHRRFILFSVLILLVLCLGLILVYNLPVVHSRLAWRVTNAWVSFKRLLNPPEQLVFMPGGARTPSGQGAVQTAVQATLDALLPVVLPTITEQLAPPQSTTQNPAGAPSQTPQPATPLPTATPTITPTPLPEQVYLSGVVHEYQQFNNCGPSNLAMALSFWGWQGDQNDTRAFLRPNRDVDDKNVNPAEMVTYVERFTGLRALTRVGGDLQLLKRLIAAGFPVLIEKGHDPRDDWWMGHYMVVNGYDDANGRFTGQDSLSNPDTPLPYESLAADWRDFNYVYVLIYPAERQAEAASLLGVYADEAYSYRAAADRALEEITHLEGRNLFFAWFNLGSSLVGLQDYAGAADAFDRAFAIYATLPEDKISEDSRPYRVMWYQAAPYAAYFYTGRYQDVIDLANTTFAWVSQPVLEESYYWRALAYEALGESERAIKDLKKALNINPNFTLAREALQRLGVEVP